MTLTSCIFFTLYMKHSTHIISLSYVKFLCLWGHLGITEKLDLTSVCVCVFFKSHLMATLLKHKSDSKLFGFLWAWEWAVLHEITNCCLYKPQTLACSMFQRNACHSYLEFIELVYLNRLCFCDASVMKHWTLNIEAFS